MDDSLYQFKKTNNKSSANLLIKEVYKNKINAKSFYKNYFIIKIFLRHILKIVNIIFLLILASLIIRSKEINKYRDFFSNQIKNDDIVKLNNIYLDKYETNIYDKIKLTIENNKCSRMWANQREFLNGAIRYFKPKKVVEIGTAVGGGTSIILNALQDIENSHLYSIDISSEKNIGECVRKFFPQFLNKWTLFTGDIAAKFIEQIGNNIDMVFIDSAHFEPGEILDFLIVLPFLKEKAIVGFHDIGNQITISRERKEWAPYIIFNMVRGKAYFPSGDKRLKHDIGIKVLDKNQNNYIHDYFRALGGQWQYFPKENHIQLVSEFIQKYYDKDCQIMFKETVEFNRKFVKINPMKDTNF